MHDGAAPLIAFYGDDNTGSTDVLEALVRNGLSSVLFLDVPGPAALRRFPGVRAVGIAGMTRTLGPEALSEELERGLKALAAFKPRICHYKICSTFDSSPEVGSIGRGIEVGARVFGTRAVPLVVGAPVLRRYTAFGNLFATVGSETYRIDRHPTMRHHPVTPMNEGDLRVHLGRQTSLPIALFDLLALAGPIEALQARWDKAAAEADPHIVLFDVLDDERLAKVGRLIWRAADAAPLFVCGSSGIEYALVPELRRLGLLPETPPPVPAIAAVEQLLVLSGSCSPVTQGQLEHVLEGLPQDRRYAGIALDVERLIDPDAAPGLVAEVVAAARASLARGRSVAIHSALGPSDPRITRAEAAYRRRAGGGSPARAIGEAQGRLLREVAAAAHADGRALRRIVIAGGDTSGHGARGLGVEALTQVAPTAPGSPLCRVHAPDAWVDGIELVLKGGQVGDTRYFERVRTGDF